MCDSWTRSYGTLFSILAFASRDEHRPVDTRRILQGLPRKEYPIPKPRLEMRATLSYDRPRLPEYRVGEMNTAAEPLGCCFFLSAAAIFIDPPNQDFSKLL